MTCSRATERFKYYNYTYKSMTAPNSPVLELQRVSKIEWAIKYNNEYLVERPIRLINVLLEIILKKVYNINAKGGWTF